MQQFYTLRLLAMWLLQLGILTGAVAQSKHLSLKGEWGRFVIETAATATTTPLVIDQLIPGAVYRLTVAAAASDPVISRVGQRAHYRAVWQGEAGKDGTLSIAISGYRAQEPIHLALAHQRLDEPLASPKSASSIITSANSNADQLVNEIFVNGSCFATSNPQIMAGGEQVGTFSNGATSVGIETGIIMSTGRVRDAAGPNDSNITGFGFNRAANDPDIAALANNRILRDVAVLEFEFTPTVSEISFDYIFASEEYCEIINNAWNDVFAFLISGPGINGPFSNGAINMAVVPNTTSPVSIKNINHTVNSSLYRNNTQPFFPDNCGLTNPVAPNFLEYDGFTALLTARATVIPCETYRLRLIIADVGDDFFDSAIFLKAGSFAAGLVTVPQPVASAEALNASTPYEGCSQGLFSFTRAIADVSQDLVVRYAISPTSTATPDLDYVAFPDSFIIPAGKMTDTLAIDILADNLPEGIETIILRIDNTCNCAEATQTLFIADPPPILIDIPTDTLCENESLTLAPIVSGGFRSYDFRWSDGSRDSLLTITQAGNYQLTVTDGCSQRAISSTNIVQSAIRATLAQGDTSLCSTADTVSIPVVLSGSNDGYVLTVDRNGTIESYLVGAVDTFRITGRPGDVLTLVGVLEVSGNTCSGLASGSYSVLSAAISINEAIDSVQCHGGADGSISLTATNATAPLTYRWAGRSDTTPTLAALSPGTYAYTVTDARGCTAMGSASLTEPLELSLRTDQLAEQNCLAAGSATLSAVGGVPPYTYRWPDGNTMASRTDLNAGTYTVTCTDANQCTTQTTITIADVRMSPPLQLATPPILNCTNAVVTLRNALTAADSMRYRWRDGSGTTLSSDATLMVGSAGTYTLLLTDLRNGCTSEASVMVAQDSSTVSFSLSPPNQLTCQRSSIDLVASVPNPPAGATYGWRGGSTNTTTLAGVALPGWYVFTAQHPQSGCTSQDSVQLLLDDNGPQAQLLTTGTLNCRDDAVGIMTVIDSAADQRLFSWTGPGITGPSNQALVEVNQAGQYTLSLTDITNGCTSQLTVSVSEDRSLPMVNAGADQILACDQLVTSVDARVTPVGLPYTYTWVDAAGDTVLRTGSGQIGRGVFMVEVTHPNSYCRASDSIIIYPLRPVEATIEVEPAYCASAGGSIKVVSVAGGTPPYRLRLEPDGQITDTDQFVGVPPGSGSLIITDASACDLVLPYTIVETNPLEVGLLAELELRRGDTLHLMPGFNRQNIASYRWTTNLNLDCTDCPQPLLVADRSGVVYLEVTDEEGCTASTSMHVIVDSRQLVYAPTAFSPTSSINSNDRFTLYGSNGVIDRIQSLDIYSRWGDHVFAGRDLPINDGSAGWDGMYRGQRAVAGGYIFRAEIILLDGESLQVAGEVLLVR